MLKTNRENIDRWFDLNLDIDSRTIYMGSMISDIDGNESGVDNLMAEYFIKGLIALEKINDKPITILMNNPGGDWYHGMAIYDAIKYSKCYIEIRVYGYAMSMGSVILQAADKRVMMPNSRLMIHYGYEGTYGPSKTVYRWADEGKRINFEMENIYLDKMLESEKKKNKKIDSAIEDILNRNLQMEYLKKEKIKYKFSTKILEKREQLRDLLQMLLEHDTILDSNEAVSLGLADEIYK